MITKLILNINHLILRLQDRNYEEITSTQGAQTVMEAELTQRVSTKTGVYLNSRVKQRGVELQSRSNCRDGMIMVMYLCQEPVEWRVAHTLWGDRNTAGDCWREQDDRDRETHCWRQDRRLIISGREQVSSLESLEWVHFVGTRSDIWLWWGVSL